MGEVAVSVVLVIAAGLLVQSLWNLRYRSRISASRGDGANHAESIVLREVGTLPGLLLELLNRMRALPGVKKWRR